MEGFLLVFHSWSTGGHPSTLVDQMCCLYFQGFRGFPGRVGTSGLDGEKVRLQLDSNEGK